MLHRPHTVARLALLGLFALASCDLRPPYVFLRLELAPAPDAPAVAVESVAVGFGPSTLTEVATGGQSFPLTATVAADAAGERELFVEARDGSGRAVARGRVAAAFSKEAQDNVTVVLRRACDADAGCENVRFCDGVARCDNAGLFGFCVRAPACATPPHACLTTVCVEADARCDLVVHHDLCPPVADADGILQPQACVPDSGCVPAVACEEGYPCRQASDPDTARVCREGQCVPSVCGDGITDPRSEACDDGNEDPGDGCDACQSTP